MDALHFAGYDANKAPAHDIAWIVRSTITVAIEAAVAIDRSLEGTPCVRRNPN
jgi:hypothetical protein